MINILAVTLCLIISGCSADYTTPDNRDLIHPDQAQALVNDDFQTPPPDSVDWYQVSLPDNWNVTRPDQGGGVWYRIPVDLPSDATQSMGVVLANFSMNASIWWDGHQVESGGNMTKPLSRNWHCPLYASLGLEQLKQGRHWLHVCVHGYPNDAAGLADVYFGPESQAFPIFNRIYFIQHTLSIVALAFTILLALGALLMWALLRRQNHNFLWMAVAASAWVIVICNFAIIDPPMPRFYWASFTHISIEFYALAQFILISRILNLRKVMLERAIALFFVSGGLIFLLFGNNADLMDWFMPMHSMALVIAFYLVWMCLTQWYQHNNPNALVMLLAVSIQLAAGGHDWWLVYFGNQLDSALIMQAGPTLTLLVVCVWMIYRFSQSLQESDAYTERIESEVIRVTASLKKEQTQIATMQKEHAVSAERERFTRDLHDGMGGYLAAISAMLHDGIKDEKLLAQTVEQALLDMRLVMDGVGEECNNVGMLLGMLRHRFEIPLKAWGMQVSWNLADLPMQCTLNDGDAIHLMRIVQEALTNAARHAHADWVKVQASVMNQPNQDRVCLEVIDNGCGWNKMPISGKGLNNMRRRAAMLSASLDISSNPGQGTRIALICPVKIDDGTSSTSTQ